MTLSAKSTTPPVLIFWIIAGWAGFGLLPWYGIEDGFWSFEWLVDGYPFDEDYAPAAFLIAQGEKLWLAPLLLPLALPLLALRHSKSDTCLCAFAGHGRCARFRVDDRAGIFHRHTRV